MFVVYTYILLALQIGFQDVGFLLSWFFPPHFLQSVVLVKASGLLYALDMWLWVSKGMIHVKYLCSNKSSFCVSLGLMAFMTLWLNISTLSFWDTTGYRTVVSVFWDTTGYRTVVSVFWDSTGYRTVVSVFWDTTGYRTVVSVCSFYIYYLSDLVGCMFLC